MGKKLEETKIFKSLSKDELDFIYSFGHALKQAYPQTFRFENFDYFEFLSRRRKLMAEIIKKAYNKLWEEEE